MFASAEIFSENPSEKTQAYGGVQSEPSTPQQMSSQTHCAMMQPITTSTRYPRDVGIATAPSRGNIGMRSRNVLDWGKKTASR